jgi:hypothetical protein
MSIREELGGLLQEFVSTSSNLIDSLVAVTEGKKSRNPEEIMTEAIEIDKKVKISIAKCKYFKTNRSSTPSRAIS